VAEEIPAPCGTEMEEVVHRMNLGQPLSNALLYSAEKYRSYELDLIRRAVGIQAEVGGSLAELLDKTNQTLRRRLKLLRQVNVLTAQSRLTGIIVGLLPFVLAATLEYTSPGYLTPLLSSVTGRLMLGAALVLQVLGVVIMTKLSTMKV
jgi:tight adherence protein B